MIPTVLPNSSQQFTGSVFGTTKYIQGGANDPYNSGTIVNPNTLPVYVQPAAGKWNWAGFFKSIVSALPFGGVIVAALGENGAGVWKTVPGVSDAEQQAVNNWLNNNLYPFITQNAAAANNIVESGSVSTANLVVLNQLLSKLCIIKTYFSINDGNLGLSEAALQLKFDAIAASCDAIAAKISEKVASSGMMLTLAPVKVNSANFDFAPLITNMVWSDYNCYNYVASSISITPTNTIKQIPAVQTATTTTVATDNSKSNRRLIMGGIGAIALILLIKK